MHGVLAVLMLLFASCSAAPRVPLDAKMRGMSFAAARPPRHYGTEASAESLRKLKALGVNWISITPFGFHRETPELRWGGNVWESEESLVAVTKQAHALGIRVLLKPHVWSRNEKAMKSWTDEQWRLYLASYEQFIEHYATVGRDAGVDAISVGNEQKLSTRFEPEWRRIIARVRTIYKGPLTYGANFDELYHVHFWDALDWIGVSAYFPLVDAPRPSREALVRAWQPIVADLARLSREQGKPIVVTEIGYRSVEGAAWRQWEVPRDAPADLDVQAAAYEAFFDAVWPQPWLAGVFPWKWFSYSEGRDAFEIENKPAERVIGRYYGGRGGER